LHALETRVPDQIIQKCGKGGVGNHCFYSYNKPHFLKIK
jgi:hypothetical protein